jgi:hypothetical protein
MLFSQGRHDDFGGSIVLIGHCCEKRHLSATGQDTFCAMNHIRHLQRPAGAPWRAAMAEAYE